jgi:galactose-1-phosphate uridylyltransferase
MSPKIPQCAFCSGAKQLRPITYKVKDIEYESYVCINCFQAVINVVLAMLEDRDLWDLIAQKLNVSPPRITETSGVIVIKPVISGYTEPELPAEPELATFRRRSHKNLRKG